MSSDSNSFLVNGTLLRTGKFGTVYPKQWLSISLNMIDLPMSDGSIQRVENKIFVIVDIEVNPQGKKRAQQEYFLKELKEGGPIVIQNLTLSKFKFKNKTTNALEEKPALKANFRKIICPEKVPPVNFNVGLIEGKVIKQGGGKLLLHQQVRIMDKVLDREVRLLARHPTDDDLLGKTVFAVAAVSGVDPNSTEERPSPFAVCDYYLVK